MADKTDDLVIGVSTDLSSVQRAIRKLDGDIARAGSQIERRFAGIGKSIDKAMPSNMQSQINKMVGIQTAATKEWTGALAEQGKEMERLRSKFSPIFSTLNNYKATVKEIQAAHRLGAISADEMASAIQRERQAALASVAALKQRGAALRASSSGNFNTANIAAQFQDIGVTAAMGMNPIQIALQQGTQLSAVLNSMGSGRQVIAGLGAAFMQIVNPISLVTIGVIAASAALFQYVSSAGKETESLDKILERHKENILRLGPAYEEIRKKANEYATDPSVVNAALADDMKKAQAKLKEEIGNTLRAIEAEMLQFAARTGGSLLGQRFAPAQELINGLREGRVEIGEFLKDVTALQTAGKLSPEAGTALRDYAQAAEDAARAISGMTVEITASDQAFVQMSQVLANDATNAMSRLSDEQRKYIESLIEGLKSGRISSDELRAALESLAQVSPDFSGTIGQLLNLTTALDDARKAAGNFVQTTAKRVFATCAALSY